jgi:hypothetical protein
MKIQVKQYFQGKMTKEQMIEPGIYDISDSALFGCGEYLVQHGFAETIPEAEQPKEQPKAKSTRRTVKKVKPNVQDSE